LLEPLQEESFHSPFAVNEAGEKKEEEGKKRKEWVLPATSGNSFLSSSHLFTCSESLVGMRGRKFLLHGRAGLRTYVPSLADAWSAGS
jgi:hypothetical protein